MSYLTHLLSGLLFFLGTFFMIASYEERATNKTYGFMWASLILYILGGLAGGLR